jgi:hypothetical protein
MALERTCGLFTEGTVFFSGGDRVASFAKDLSSGESSLSDLKVGGDHSSGGAKKAGPFLTLPFFCRFTS